MTTIQTETDTTRTETKTGSTGLLTGTFRDRAAAERAYDDLIARGYRASEINLLMSEDTRKEHFSSNEPTTDLGTKAATGGLTGATVGGTVGAIAGVLALAGTLAIPGLGLVLAGPLAAGLAGLGAGAATGGVIGALVGAGIPEDHAKRYEEDLKSGGILVAVHPRNAQDAAQLQQEWAKQGEVGTVAQ